MTREVGARPEESGVTKLGQRIKRLGDGQCQSLQDGLRDDKRYWEGGARGRTQVFRLGFLNYGKKLTLFYDDLSLDLIWILTWIKVPSLHQHFLANKGHQDQLLSRVASAFRIIPVINKVSFA